MNLESREKLAKLIQELRGTQTLSGFAKQFNVSYQAVSKWENCESVPDREHLAKIAKISGYGLDDFVAYLEGKQPQTPTKLGHLKQQVKDLRIGELMEIYRAVGERITELSIGERVGSR